MTYESTDGDPAPEQGSAVESTPVAQQPAGAESTNETELGIDENVGGALSYLFGFVTGVALYFLETENTFVRFHAAQSIVLSVGLFAFFFGVFVFQFVLGFVLGDVFAIGFIISIGFLLFWMALTFGTFLLYLYMMFSAYKGRTKRLPIVAAIAENHLL